MFLAPIFLVLFMTKQFEWLVAVVVIAELSDVFDGYVARKYKIVTNFGKLMDPYADSIYRFTAFLCFLHAGYAKPWMVAMVAIIFYRDVAVTIIRNFGVLSNIVVAARTSGKIKAIVQSTVINIIIGIIVLNEHFDFDFFTKNEGQIFDYLMLVATLVTLISGFDYIYGNWHIISKYKK